jgi:hypothetical protein
MLDLKINSFAINVGEELDVLVNMYDAARYRARQRRADVPLARLAPGIELLTVIFVLRSIRGKR